MKKSVITWLVCLFVLLTTFLHAQQVNIFPLSEVRLLEGPFKDAQQVDLKYMLSLDVDRLLAPYCKDAGIATKAVNYPNWESSGLDGHTAGHYLSALAMMYASTGNREMLKRSDYMVSILAQCQDKNGNGYVGGIPNTKNMWKDVAIGKFSGDKFSFDKQWVPWYNLHKLFAGLRDVYLFTDNTRAKEVLIKLCDWSNNLVARLTDEQIQKMLNTEQGGMNEVFADVYKMTGDPKYMVLAKKFSHKVILEPLLQGQDKLNGLHANTQIPKVIGFERISELDADTTWHQAADFFWNTVVSNRTVAFGGNSVREHFNPSADFTSMLEDREGPETCNTYNMLKLSRMLYTDNRSLKYIEYYERALYNHILSSQRPVTGGFVYFTPIRPQHYRVYSKPQEGFWCCVGTGMENHSKYGELIYAHTKDQLFVNLFIASELNWKEKGISLIQQTNFPESENTSLKLRLARPSTFTINIRYPSWVKAGALEIAVNGKKEMTNAQPSSYIAIKREWKTGDVIAVRLPMQLHTEYLPDHSPWVSFLYGPIVLAAKTDSSNLDGLFADESRMGHIAAGKFYPIEDAPMIVSDEKDFAKEWQPVGNQPLTFTATGLVYPAKFSNLQLTPFYKLHDARYMMYWESTTHKGLDSIKQDIHLKETAKLALEAKTIDQVAPGEQQPESDHHFQSEQSSTGINMDRHWRDARGWFSYDLKDKHQEAATIQITYWGKDRGRVFDILINDTLIATQSLDGNMGSTFFPVNYTIPMSLLKKTDNAIYTIKFAAKPGSGTGGIYYLRLLRNQ